jgi:hypothetical protein
MEGDESVVQEAKRVVFEYLKGYCRVLAHVEQDWLTGVGKERYYPVVEET